MDAHTQEGEYYDDERFWPVFAMAQELDVPLYLHPCGADGDGERGAVQGGFIAGGVR